MKRLFPCSQLSRALRGAHRPFLLISFFGVPEVHLGCGAHAGDHPSSPLPAPSPAAPPGRPSVDPARQRVGPHLHARYRASIRESFRQPDTTATLSSSFSSGGEDPEGVPAAVALPESGLRGRGPVYRGPGSTHGERAAVTGAHQSQHHRADGRCDRHGVCVCV